ncbi:DUF4089 domain-containing protein [Novosphingobium sp. PP1Y]|uniref:DUF4089 domain-containing protein n=1 Tax=Novosphingobium sp. PP1Y TaxID=702113 RepID=UPI00059F29E6|nr:DUF4089 domain-containing protein [Novosphingobium sp. PP1Y]
MKFAGHLTDADRQAYMDAASRLAGLTIPEECRDGVHANLRLFLDHAAVLDEIVDPFRDPAELL